MKEEWRYAIKDAGGQFVMIHGIIEMLKLSVDNLALQYQVHNNVNVQPSCFPISTVEHPDSKLGTAGFVLYWVVSLQGYFSLNHCKQLF